MKSIYLITAIVTAFSALSPAQDLVVDGPGNIVVTGPAPIPFKIDGMARLEPSQFQKYYENIPQVPEGKLFVVEQVSINFHGYDLNNINALSAVNLKFYSNGYAGSVTAVPPSNGLSTLAIYSYTQPMKMVLHPGQISVFCNLDATAHIKDISFALSGYLVDK
jgi:hypothetical protein